MAALVFGVPIYWFVRLRYERKRFQSGALRPGVSSSGSGSTSNLRTDISFLYQEYRAKEAVPLTKANTTATGVRAFITRVGGALSNLEHIIETRMTAGERITLYWGFVTLLRKLLLAMLAWLPSVDEKAGNTQAVAGLIILAVFSALHFIVRPFNFREGNILEGVNLIILIVVLAVGLYLQNGNPSDLTVDIIGIILIVLILVSTVFGVYLMIRTEWLIRKVKRAEKEAYASEMHERKPSKADLKKNQKSVPKINAPPLLNSSSQQASRQSALQAKGISPQRSPSRSRNPSPAKR